MNSSTNKQEPQPSTINPPGQFLQNQNRIQPISQGWNYQIEQKKLS
jgi:hypothetical protein